jgi:hypothetical protein
MTFRHTAILCLAAAALCRPADAQTLAKKGWIGSGITVESWWNGAVLYQLDPVSFQDSTGDGFGDLPGIVQRLDYLQSLSIDAILLSPLELQPDSTVPFDPKYGTAEDFDALIQQASLHKIRVFVDLPFGPAHTAQQLLNEARFWLSRGVAGLRLTPEPTASTAPLSPAQTTDRLRELRRLCSTYAGQRVLLWDLPNPLPTGSQGYATRRASSAPRPAEGPQMAVDKRLSDLPNLAAPDLRRALAFDSTLTPVPITDASNHPRSLDRLGDGTHDQDRAKLLAAALLTARGAPLLYFGQEIGMATTATSGGATVDPTPMQWGGEPGFTTGVPWIDMGRNAATADVALEDADAGSLLNWYRRLSALRHSSEAIRTGTLDLLADTNPDVVAWVRRPVQPGSLVASVVVVANLSGRTQQVSLGSDLRRTGAASSDATLHTLAASWLITRVAQEAVSGFVSANSITLPPYGIYLGELPHEARSAEPKPHTRRHRRR